MAVNDLEAVKEVLEADTNLVAVVDNRIYSGRRFPPTKWVPSKGSAVIFDIRSVLTDEENAAQFISYQFKLYGKGKDEQTQIDNAYALHLLVQDALIHKKSSKILGVQLDGGGQTLEENNACRYFVLVFYRIQIRNISS